VSSIANKVRRGEAGGKQKGGREGTGMTHNRHTIELGVRSPEPFLPNNGEWSLIALIRVSEVTLPYGGRQPTGTALGGKMYSTKNIQETLLILLRKNAISKSRSQ